MKVLRHNKRRTVIYILGLTAGIVILITGRLAGHPAAIRLTGHLIPIWLAGHPIAIRRTGRLVPIWLTIHLIAIRSTGHLVSIRLTGHSAAIR